MKTDNTGLNNFNLKYLDRQLFMSFKSKRERRGSLMDVTKTRRPVSMKMYQNHDGFMVFMLMTEECDLLSCNAVYFGESLMFWRNVSPQSSGSKNNPRGQQKLVAS
jgi:hypothetical protein